MDEPATVARPTAAAVPTTDLSELPADLVQPQNLVYQGAFRLPDRAPGAPDAEGWEYGGQALAYRPDGDPEGDEDGYPGSLFGTGHDVWNFVSEISVPAPSASRDLGQLKVAETIQGFHDVRGGLFDGLDEIPRVGMAYLPAQGRQTSPKLHLAWGQHLHGEGEPSDTPSHAWCDIDLAHPNTAGAWWIGDASLYSVNGYVFEIPRSWAEGYLGGAKLASGRFRDGGWSGKGPALFAYGPWLEGNPPPAGAHLTARALLLYSASDDPDQHTLNDYHDSDEWEGGAWITAGERAAVVFVGTKGGGDHWWYGSYSPAGDGRPCPHIDGVEGVMCFDADGTACAPEMSGRCEGYLAESRGWWSSRFDAQIIFYNPADLVAVSKGEMEPYEPQPYATLDIDEHLFLQATVETAVLGTGDQRRYRVGEAAYDREHGILFIPERFADGAKPVIHVWSIRQ